MLNFRWADINDLDFLVNLRIWDLKLYSEHEISDQTVNKIKHFYQTGMSNETCFTLLCFDNELLVACGCLYIYETMPSNENPMGTTGQLTNIWLDESFRHQGIGRQIVNELLTKAKSKCQVVCLNSSNNAVDFYKKLGFETKERHMSKKLF